jgi:hypothetical protein
MEKLNSHVGAVCPSTFSLSHLVLPQLGSAGFGFVFAGFAGGSATLVNQANYFQLAPASSSWLATHQQNR